MPELGDIIRGNKVGYADHRKYIWSACSVCGKVRWVALVKGGPRYIKCRKCRKCRGWTSGYNRSGENSPRWKGGISKWKGRKYIQVWQPKEKCIIREHRLVMEKHLGRKLIHNEVVHHINNNTLDNRIENLVLFKNNSEHLGSHRGNYRKLHHNTFDRKKYQAKYYRNNLEKLKEYGEEYYRNNLEKLKEYKKLWYINKHKNKKT